MQLKTILLSTALAAAPLLASAAEAPDPLFGDDPQAKAVLDCHAAYARHFTAGLKVEASPTEIATAAYAHCIGQFNAFVSASLASAEARNDAHAITDPRAYRAEQAAAMRDYAFAYTLDVYLNLSSVL